MDQQCGENLQLYFHKVDKITLRISYKTLKFWEFQILFILASLEENQDNFGYIQYYVHKFCNMI